MNSVAELLLQRKILRRVGPVVFVTLAGVGLAACGSAGAPTGSGSQHTTTRNPPTSGGTSF
jgi:hypothetical protein